MSWNEEERSDPFARLTRADPAQVAEEPAVALGMVSALNRRPPARKRLPSPSEIDRRRRSLTVVFSQEHADLPDRLRRVALGRGLYGPDGKSPNTSAIVELLVLGQRSLEDLEQEVMAESQAPSPKGAGDSWF